MSDHALIMMSSRSLDVRERLLSQLLMSTSTASECAWPSPPDSQALNHDRHSSLRIAPSAISVQSTVCTVETTSSNFWRQIILREQSPTFYTKEHFNTVQYHKTWSFKKTMSYDTVHNSKPAFPFLRLMLRLDCDVGEITDCHALRFEPAAVSSER